MVCKTAKKHCHQKDLIDKKQNQDGVPALILPVTFILPTSRNRRTRLLLTLFSEPDYDIQKRGSVSLAFATCHCVAVDYYSVKRFILRTSVLIQ